MAAISNQSSWRDRAIVRSEGITDAWEVTKTYAGRLAEWVLFACMVFCIVEILPGVSMWIWLSNTILGVQAVTLDIGGFALSSMADQARSNGDEQAARKADITGRFLIGIVILTLTLITIGLLYAPARPFTDGAEKVLILVRVIFTVIYGHVIHSLRRRTLVITPMQIQQQPDDDVIQELRTGMERLSEQVVNLQAAHCSAQRDPESDPESDPQIVQIEDYFEESTEGSDVNPSPAPRVTRQLTPERPTQKVRGEAQQKASRILKRTPDIGPTELSKRANISLSSAKRILATAR